MGDRSAVTLRFRSEGMPDSTLEAIIEVMEFEVDEYSMRDARAGELLIEETSLGTDADIQQGLLDLIANGARDEDDNVIPVADFAFAILQDPKYEYNGVLRKHTPGLPDYVNDASASWEPILSQAYWTTTLAHATDLDTLRRQVRTALGLDHAL